MKVRALLTVDYVIDVEVPDGTNLEDCRDAIFDEIEKDEHCASSELRAFTTKELPGEEIKPAYRAVFTDGLWDLKEIA